MAKKTTIALFIAFLAVVLISMSTLALWSMVNHGVKDMLAIGGIDNFYIQGSIIVIGSLMILFVIGLFFRKYKFGKIVKDILKL